MKLDTLWVTSLNLIVGLLAAPVWAQGLPSPGTQQLLAAGPTQLAQVTPHAMWTGLQSAPIGTPVAVGPSVSVPQQHAYPQPQADRTSFTMSSGAGAWPAQPNMPPLLSWAAYGNRPQQNFPVAQAAVGGGMPFQSLGDRLSTCAFCQNAGCQQCSGCLHCGGAGCGNCQQVGLWGAHGPYGNAGCCRPRWFDIYVGGVYLKRENVSRFVPFTSNGIAGNAPPDLVLTTDDLDFDTEELGLRITTSHLVGPGSHLEVTYQGLSNFKTGAAVVTSPLGGLPANNLYSTFSQFGNFPFTGFLETDQASFHSIEYSGDFNSVEMNLRHRWISPQCRFHCSGLVGLRYVRIVEGFLHRTIVDVHDDPFTFPPAFPEDPFERGPGFMNYLINTRNDMVGLQIGGDAFFCIHPAIKVGSEAKVGVYGNHASQDTTIEATRLIPKLEERESDAEVSGVGEANLMGIWRIGPHATLRAGYQLLYIQNVALAPEQFNRIPPNVFFPPPGVNRYVSVNTHGELFYYGWQGGLEWTW